MSAGSRIAIRAAWIIGFALPLACGSSHAAPAVVSVTMNANDVSGSGSNPRETALNVHTVSPSTFGKLFSVSVDGDQYAEPLYAGGLKIGDATRNVVFAATSNDSVYAIDADDPSGHVLWQQTVGNPSPMPNAYVGNAINLDLSNAHAEAAAAKLCTETPKFINELGVTATPVLDLAHGLLYVIAVDVDASHTIPGSFCVYADPSKSNYCQTYMCSAPTYRYRLHALDLATGQERTGSPVVVEGSVPGTAVDAKGGTLTFNAMTQLVRTSLLLANGNLYFGTAGYSDYNVYHGWVFAYDAATFKQVGVFVDTPDGSSGGIWQGGRSLLSDATGNIYAVSGNGNFDVNSGGNDYGDSIMKLSPDLTEVEDYFSPFLSDYNGQNILANDDIDLSSAGATMIPGTTLVLVTGKLGNGYLVDTANLGKFRAAGNGNTIQTIRLAWLTSTTSCASQTNFAIVSSTPVVWKGADTTHLFVWGGLDNLREYALDGNGKFATNGLCFCPGGSSGTDVPDPDCGAPHSKNSEVASFYGGGALAVSSNGTEAGTGLLWATHATTGNPNAQSRPGALEAYDATNVTSPLWSSVTNASDALGDWAKYAPPTVANGKVYVPTFSNQLVVYGLVSSK